MVKLFWQMYVIMLVCGLTYSDQMYRRWYLRYHGNTGSGEAWGQPRLHAKGLGSSIPKFLGLFLNACTLYDVAC